MKSFNYVSLAFAAVFFVVGSVASAGIVPVASYSYDSPAAWATHWSTTATEYTTPVLLTDGIGNVDAAASDFQDGSSVGFVLSGDASPQPLISVDLGGTFDVDALDLYYLVDNLSGILNPASVSVSGSTDGVTFSPLGSFAAFPSVGAGDQENRLASVDLGGATVSHLQIDVRNGADFVFLTEFEVQEAVGVPEPASLLLLGIGSLGIVALRRR